MRIAQFGLKPGIIALTLILALLSILFSLSVGAVNIDVTSTLAQLFIPAATASIEQQILLELRLPRILLAFIAGSGLALAGHILQMVTRNPLADPYLFGVSAGASLGAVIVIAFGASVGMSLTLGALVGAAVATTVVLFLAGGRLSQQSERMVLAGVACAFLFSAMASFILYFANPQAAASVLFWSLGSFANASWLGVTASAITLALVATASLTLHRPLLALASGDHSAHSLGVNPVKMRLIMLGLCSVLTAVLVANCGGIGFVGLMIPHLARLLLKQHISQLMVMLLGGLFMVWVDTLARSLLSGQELPVGIITAFIGSLFFLGLLKRHG